MRYYEMICIVHPNMPDDEVSVVTDKVSSIIDRNKGEVLNLDNWGKRRCAHKIKKCTKGNYFLLHFKADPAVLPELHRTLRYNEKVLRFQTVLAEKETIAALTKVKEAQNGEVSEVLPETGAPPADG